MQISKVLINGFHNVACKEYSFNNLTYITGPNGAGKSTILNAIVYALFGYIPGTSKNSNEALFKHSNSNTMSVTLTLDNGGEALTICRSLTKSGAKYISSFNIDPDVYTIEDIISDIELPVFNFSEFINMTANKLKDWFINFLPSSDFKTDWNTVLRDAIGYTNILDDQLVPSTIEAINNFHLSGLDEIRKTNEYIKAAISFKKQEIQRLQSTTQSLVYYDDFDCATTQEELRAQISQYRTYKSLVTEYNKYVEHNNQISARLSMLQDVPDTQVLRATIDAERANFTRISEEVLKLNTLISTLKAEITSKSRVINGGGVCPYTSTQCSEISKLVSDYRNQVLQDTSKLNEYTRQLTQLNSELNVSTNKINTQEEQFRRVMKQQSEYESLKASYVELPDISGCPSIETIESTLDELQDKLVKLTANETYQNMIDKLSKEKNILSQSLEILKKWETLTGVNGMQTTSGEDPFESFAKSIETYIPVVFSNGSKIYFNHQGKSNTFNFGLMRNNKYIPFDLLSSGEKCIFTVGLLIAVIKQSSSKLKILVIDDLFDHLDTNNMDQSLRLLQNITDVQMIFAGVQELQYDYENVSTINVTRGN